MIASTEYVTILFGMEGGGLERSLGRSEIKRELDQDISMETCLGFFPSYLGSPLVQDIWSYIAREFYLFILIGISIGQSWA